MTRYTNDRLAARVRASQAHEWPEASPQHRDHPGAQDVRLGGRIGTGVDQ